ncbi:peptidylprolyl isomerase, partial [Staphylococcus aureus]|nr:peptidylprolyl isomerase [Staphylococcus aureus]
VQMKDVPQNMLSQLADGGWHQPIVDAYGEKGGTPLLDQKHTVFGQIFDGETTLEDISNTKVGPQDKPIHDFVIESIDV